MTETSKNIWDAVDAAVKHYYEEVPEIAQWDFHYVTTANMEYLIKLSGNPLLTCVSMIGLKRKVGQYFKDNGWVKTSRNGWHKPSPVEEVKEEPPIPRWAIDMYLSLLQSEAILEKQYPDIVKAVEP